MPTGSHPEAEESSPTQWTSARMLLDEIIEILSNEKGSLNSALLKTKVLLHSLGKKDLASWVTNELKGYPDENVPEYRRVSAEVHGHVTSYAWQANDYVLPIMHLSEKQRKNLTESVCTMSIASIEESIRSGKKLIRHLPPEFGALFQKVLTPGTHVFSSWCAINMVDIENILSEVRSRLLDFALELRDVVGIDVPEKELAAKAASVDTEKLFNTAVYGTGNTIIIGSHAFQAITNEKDDIDGLLAAVAQLGFQQGELDGLRHAVLEDKAQGKTPDVAEGATCPFGEYA
jgi:hypothetical protein